MESVAKVFLMLTCIIRFIQILLNSDLPVNILGVSQTHLARLSPIIIYLMSGVINL